MPQTEKDDNGKPRM